MSKIALVAARRAATVATLAASLLLGPAVIAGLDMPRAETEAGFDDSASLSGAYLAGRAAGTQRDAQSAARFYRQALSEDPGNVTLIERSLALSLVAGQMDEAMDLADRLLDNDEAHSLAHLALGVRAIRDEDYEAARDHLDEAGTGALAELTAKLLLAWTEAGAGNQQAAIDLVSGLIGPDWYEVFKPYHSGLIAEVGGDQSIAGAFFEQAHSTDNGALRIVQVWARHLAASGEPEQAAEVLAGFSQILPNHPLIMEAAETIAAGGVPDPVVADAKEGAAEVLYGIGSALGTEGGEEYAAIYLQLALYLAPEQPLALLSLADYYEKADNHEQAIETYARMPEESPLKRNAEIHRALNYNDLERYDEAKRVLRNLVEQHPDDMEAIVALGNILRSNEDFAEAADVYSLAIDQIDEPQPHQWTVYYFRGIAYERAKQWDRAEADLLQALALFPEQPHVLNYLGYSWVDQGLHLDEAMEMIERAVELRPSDGYIVDSLGWAHYRLGEYDEAVRELERAVELRPEDPVINDHLGDAYWKVGRKLEARFQWAHARDLDPEPEALETILSKLENGLTKDEPSAAELSRETVN